MKVAVKINDYAEFINDSPVAVYGCDGNGFIKFYNEAAIKLWGREPAIDRDKWCGSFKMYDSAGQAIALSDSPMAERLKAGYEADFSEVIIETPQGNKRNVKIFLKSVINTEGEIMMVIATLLDETERKKNGILEGQNEDYIAKLADELESRANEKNSELQYRNAELKKSEERYHKMIEEVRDYAIILLDKDGTILNWNKGAENIKGYSEKEILGKNFRMFYLPADRQNQLPERLINQAIEQGKAMDEGFRVKKDGSTFWGSITITALHDADHNIIGFSKVTRDLTERKLAEDRLQQYAMELERQNRELGRYAYVASHDLQEPLRKIQTFSSLANTTSDQDKLKGYLSKISASAERMSALIKGMLNYARIADAQKEYVNTDLDVVFKNIQEDFELMISDKKATINCAPLPIIKGVPTEMYQLFSNLLSNALKFCEQQPIINITTERMSPDLLSAYPDLNQKGSYVKIGFSDNGIGFEPIYANEIFDLFKRLNNTKTYAGTGLGLAVCKKIVEGHDGIIYARSEPGKGTTFTIILPVI